MDFDSTFNEWSGMHQPVDWDYTGFMPDMFAPITTASPVQQTVAVTTIAPAPATYFPSSWPSSMHQPVDWDIPAVLPGPPVGANQPSSQPIQATAVAQPQPATAVQGAAPSALQRASSMLTSATTTGAGQAQGQAQGQQKEAGGNSNKRDRSVRRTKSAALRPQQQQMLDLQKKLDALMQEHTVVEAENERLKTRLRVLEAVLPVRQQQARWAQSKAATETRAPQPTDPVLANLIDLATSGPSSCATSPSPSPLRAEAATGNATTGTGYCEVAEDEAAAAQQQQQQLQQHQLDMAAGSPMPAPASGEPAPCASSSCGGTSTTATTTTSGALADMPAPSTGAGTGPCRRSRSCFHTTRGAGDRHNHYHHHHHLTINKNNNSHYRSHARGHDSHHGCSGGGRRFHGGGCCSAPHHAESHTRWLDAWRTWVREAALLLQTYDARPSDHYLTRLEEAFTKLKSEVVHLGLRHPELICNMRCVNLETGAEQEFPPDSFWSLVVAGMKLDVQQVANCKSALTLYRERMAVVLAERRSLAARMSSCLTALQHEEADGRAAPGSRRREQLTLEAEEAAAALDANVAVEGHTTSLARDLLGSNLFSRLQCARASVLSYPYFPDALAIISAAVGEHDTPLPPPAAPPGAPQPQQQTRSGENLAAVPLA